MSLHNNIMNLPCKPDNGWPAGEQYAYKLGHRDARHAAAELAIKYDYRLEALELALASCRIYVKLAEGNETCEAYGKGTLYMINNLIGEPK